MIDSLLEKQSWANGKLLLACDEAGYGCLAGSMFVAGVAFPKDFDFSKLPKLNDSKALTEKQRFALEEPIRSSAEYWFCCEITPTEIDNGKPYYIRFQTAELKIVELDIIGKVDVIMDGNIPLKVHGARSSCLVKGDSKCLSIAAASVLAKCAKDRQMIELDSVHPEYGWASNKGYESQLHRDAIIEHGLTRFHRRSYCKKYLGDPCT